MASNLLNPIQLLRGTSAAIAAAQGKEGTLYYDNNLESLRMANGKGAYRIIPRVFEDDASWPIIYVDAVNGNDNNSGATQSEPVKSLSKAFVMCSAFAANRRPTIQLASGQYIWDDAQPAFDKSINIQGVDDTIIVSSTDIYVNASLVSFKHVNIQLDGYIIASGGFVQLENSTVLYTGQDSISRYNIGAIDNGTVTLLNITIDGNGKTLYSSIYASCGGCIRFYSDNMSTIKNVHSSTGTIVASSGCSVVTGGAIIDGGNVSGKRYHLTKNSVIDTLGTGQNAIPGTEAGIIDASSVYI